MTPQVIFSIQEVFIECHMKQLIECHMKQLIECHMKQLNIYYSLSQLSWAQFETGN